MLYNKNQLLKNKNILKEGGIEMFQMNSNCDKRVENFACGGQDVRERSWCYTSECCSKSIYCREDMRNVREVISGGANYRIIAQGKDTNSGYVR